MFVAVFPVCLLWAHKIALLFGLEGSLLQLEQIIIERFKCSEKMKIILKIGG
jgi:hypothetical protein